MRWYQVRWYQVRWLQKGRYDRHEWTASTVMFPVLVGVLVAARLLEHGAGLSLPTGALGAGAFGLAFVRTRKRLTLWLRRRSDDT